MGFGSNLGAERDYSTGVEDVGYRPISAMAVFCFAMAVLCSMAMWAMFFWILPPIILVLSIMTSRSLEEARVEYGGQLLAKLAILLSLAFLIAAPTRYFLERFIIVKEAKEVSAEFLDNILLNHVKAAFIPTRQPIERVGLENEPDEIVTRAGANYRRFLTELHVSRVRGRLKDAQCKFDRVIGYGYEQGAYYVMCRYTIDLDDRDYTPGVVAGLMGENLNNKPYVRKIHYSFDLRGGTAPNSEWKGRKWWIKTAVANEISANE